MQPAGVETLARWREVGEWWKGEQPQEVHRFVDAKGILREEIGPIAAAPEVTSEVRIRRVRDEKVSLATGHFTPPKYGKRRNLGEPGVLLHALSGYAFCRGTMIAAEVPAFAAERGYGAALLADPFSLVGAVEFCRSAAEVEVHPLIGVTFEMADGGELVLVAKTKMGYRSLSRLITECHLQEPRQYPLCNWERLAKHAEGVLCLTGGSLGPIDRVLIRRDTESAACVLERLIRIYGREDVFIQVERSYLPWAISVEKQLLDLAQAYKITAVAGGPILHQNRAHFPAHDVLVCVETRCLIDEIDGRKPPRDETQPSIQAPPRRSINSERFMRSTPGLRKLFPDHPELISNAWKIVERCEKDVLPGRTNLPQFCEGENEMLRQIVDMGAHSRYSKICRKLRKRIDLEVDRIIRLNFARHFLVAWDMCNWAREQQILLSGRGSVVDSIVAYCMGITRIDALEFDLHFDRFLPSDGSKRPDIDIDFEAARREDVRQYLRHKYGDEHVATVAAIGTFGSRGIIREVGKVMGIPEESIGYLSKRLPLSLPASACAASSACLSSLLENKSLLLVP